MGISGLLLVAPPRELLFLLQQQQMRMMMTITTRNARHPPMIPHISAFVRPEFVRAPVSAVTFDLVIVSLVAVVLGGKAK